MVAFSQLCGWTREGFRELEQQLRPHNTIRELRDDVRKFTRHADQKTRCSVGTELFASSIAPLQSRTTALASTIRLSSTHKRVLLDLAHAMSIIPASEGYMLSLGRKARDGKAALSLLPISYGRGTNARRRALASMPSKPEKASSSWTTTAAARAAGAAAAATAASSSSASAKRSVQPAGLFGSEQRASDSDTDVGASSQQNAATSFAGAGLLLHQADGWHGIEQGGFVDTQLFHSYGAPRVLQHQQTAVMPEEQVEI